jgi:hypothetical protein
LSGQEGQICKFKKFDFVPVVIVFSILHLPSVVFPAAVQINVSLMASDGNIETHAPKKALQPKFFGTS